MVSRPALDGGNWEQVGIVYKDNKAPILLEVSRDDGDDESLMREEIREFVEFLEDAAGKSSSSSISFIIQAP